jgi:hypothetical protein
LSNLCREIYYGDTLRALRARYVFIVFDLLVVSYFVVTTFLDFYEWVIYIDMAIGVILAVDFVGRLLADSDRGAFLVKPMTIVDFIVIASLFVPALIGNFVFLRLVRSLRLLRSYIVARQFRNHSRFFARNEDVIFSVLNLTVFIFVVTAAVFAHVVILVQARLHELQWQTFEIPGTVHLIGIPIPDYSQLGELSPEFPSRRHMLSLRRGLGAGSSNRRRDRRACRSN